MSVGLIFYGQHIIKPYFFNSCSFYSYSCGVFFKTLYSRRKVFGEFCLASANNYWGAIFYFNNLSKLDTVFCPVLYVFSLPYLVYTAEIRSINLFFLLKTCST
jgi:hypothetical protein